MVGASGNAASRLRAGDGEQLEAAALHEGHRRGGGDEHQVRLAADQAGDRRAGAALVGHVHHVEAAGDLAEHLGLEPVLAAAARRGVVQLAGIRLGDRDQLLHRVRLDIADATTSTPGTSTTCVTAMKSLVGATLQLREHRRVDRDGADVAEEDGVAVGRGLRRRVQADVARGAGAVLDHDLLAEQLGQARLQDAADEVRRAAGRERHDHAHRLVGVLRARPATERAMPERQEACIMIPP